MSPFDVPPDEMGIDPKITDEELDALLCGQPTAHQASSDLARFVEDLRATFPADAPASDAHLAAIFETTRLLADNGDPVARPASNADAPVPQVSRLPKRREHRMKERKLRVLVLRVAAPIVALFTVLGIMGSAGALPRGLQRMTSHAAGLVGFDLPSGEDEQGDVTNEDDQGENDDSQGDTKDESGATDENDQGDDSQGDSTSTSTDPTNEDDQGDQGGTTSTDPSEGDQGENDDSQGDSTSTDPTNQDDQGENDQGSTTNQDDQGDNSQDDTSTTSGSNQDDQGSGDSGDSGSGDNNQN